MRSLSFSRTEPWGYSNPPRKNKGNYRHELQASFELLILLRLSKSICWCSKNVLIGARDHGPNMQSLAGFTNWIGWMMIMSGSGLGPVRSGGRPPSARRLS